ncbi:MAG: TolC family protein [Bacteroidales bacterium]|nr:TolC family protein [Bacteroidales bacterium]
MRKRIGILSLLLCLSALVRVCGQQAYTLDDLFRLADDHSTTLQVSATAVASAEDGVRAARAARAPELGVELSVGYLGNGWLGDRNFTNWEKVENPHLTNSFYVKALQVVYAGGALYSGVRLAELGKEMAELDLKSHRQEVRLLIASHYLDLCRLQNQAAVLDENIALTDTLIANTRARVNSGTALDNDITRHELQLETLKLQCEKVADAISILRNQLAVTLHTPILRDAVFAFSADDAVQLFSEADWQERALNDNTGLQQARTATNISEQQVKLVRSKMIPKIVVVAENHFDGPITIEVPVINKNFNYWFAGLGVQYDFSSLWKSHRELTRARLDLAKSQQESTLAQEEVSKAVQAAYVNYQTAQSELRTQQKSVQLAEEHYSVTENRYSNGLALLTDMLDASNMKLSAELALVNARINILYNYYQLLYICSNL